jgi:nucleotide-binding universal stress UspA family protein
VTGQVIVWLTETSWAACVDAACAWTPAVADVVLLHVADDEAAEVAHGAFLGLLGRGRRPNDPGRVIAAASAAAATELLEAAAQRLGRPAARVQRHGRAEHQVVQAAAGADLLVCARDGDRGRLGPRSLGPATRFVVDHASCPVLLVWPGPAPDVGTLPPPPPAGGRPPPPPPHGGPPAPHG